ncbi:MAG: PDZ domain-containing protein [Planctomycetaceae bacterium]|nr:PDZ domain-containing protein [Planctomycetaceae bacterium]
MKSPFLIRSGATWIAVLVTAVVWTAIVALLASIERQAVQGTRHDLANLARLFDEHVSRLVRSTDVAMVAMRRTLEGDAAGFRLEAWLAQNAGLIEDLPQIGVIDARGILVATSVGPLPARIDLSDREHFRVHAEAGGADRLFVSKPVLGRASGKYTIQLTRPYRDKDGRFQFDGLDSMLAYNLSVREAGIGTGYAYNVAAGDNSDIFISSSLIPVNGRLVCPSGSLPASFTIQGFDATAQYRYAMVTEQFSSKDGTFTIMVSKAGEWIFTATAQGFYQSEERSITVAETGGEVELPLTEGARLNGRVLSTGNNEPLPNINITLHWPAGIQDKDAQKSKASSRNASTSFGESSGEIMMSGFGGRYSTSSSSKTNGGQAAYASTDSLGRFSFDSLEPGTYTLRAVVGQKTIEEGITLGTGETKHDVFVDIGAILAITVTAQSNEPILQPRVSLSVLNDQGEPQSGIGVSQLDSAPGRLRYAGIEPGKYRVTVQAEGYAPAYQDVTLAAGDNPLAFTLEQGCFVRGIVTMSDGSAIPQQMYVRVTDPNAPPQGRNGSNQNIVGINGTEGRFNLGPLSPGVKTIEVVSYQYSRSDPNDPYRSRFKTTLTLVAGDNLCDMSVEPGCLLTITVFDEAGNVIRNAIDVRPLDMNTAAMYSGSCRGPGQPAVIEVLDAGRYSVTANGGGSNLLASTIEVYAHQGINDISVTLFAGNCVRITQVMDNSQAKAAGLQVGDLIVTYNGQNVTSINDLSTFRKQVPDNQPASVVVDRNGAILTFDIKGGYIGVNGESARR